MTHQCQHADELSPPPCLAVRISNIKLFTRPEPQAPFPSANQMLAQHAGIVVDVASGTLTPNIMRKVRSHIVRGHVPILFLCHWAPTAFLTNLPASFCLFGSRLPVLTAYRLQMFACHIKLEHFFLLHLPPVSHVFGSKPDVRYVKKYHVIEMKTELCCFFCWVWLRFKLFVPTVHLWVNE